MKAKRTIHERIRAIHQGLDLGFSDHYQHENVRDRTLVAKLAELEEADQLLAVEEGMNFSLFQALGESHSSPEIYALDFPSDLRASFYLLLGGYYRQAILALRNWLEMRLLGVYFGRIDLNGKHYLDWKRDRFEAPFGRVLVRRLFALVEFRKADAQVGLRRQLEILYSDLSAFTHGAGLGKYNLQADTDNVPRYNSASVDLWARLMRRVFSQIAICLFIAYGEKAFRSLDQEEVRRVLSHLPLKYRNYIRAAIVLAKSAHSVGSRRP